MSYIINVVDTETTGLQGPPKGDLVEIGITRLTVLYDDFDTKVTAVRIGETKSWLCDPEMPIDLGAMAVHHITQDMVRGEIPASKLREKVETIEADYWAAHHVAFDGKFLKPKKGDWVCTLKTAKVLYPEAPAHKNMVLRYYLGLDRMMDPSRINDAMTHRAGFDSYVTACLLATMLYRNDMHIRDMAKLFNPQKDIPQGDVVPFGKYQGQPWKNVPRSYLVWITKNMQNAEIVATARKYLKG